MASLALSPKPFPSTSSPWSQRSHASSESLLMPFSMSSRSRESERENAPFKPGPDDETSLGMYHKKIGKKVNRRQLLKHSDEFGEARPLLLTNSPPAEDPMNLWFRRTSTLADFEPKGFDCSLIRQDSVAQYRRKITSRQQLSQVDENGRGSSNDTEEYESANILGLARALSIGNKVGQSLVGETVRPVASLINAVCISSESALLPEQSNLRSFSFGATQKHRGRSRNEKYRSGIRKRPTIRGKETPASITLRKASHVPHAEQTSRPMSIANRLFGWFQDSHNSKPPNRLVGNHQVKFDLSLPSHDTLPVRQHRLSCVAVSQSAQSSLDLLGHQEDLAHSRQKQHSVTADFALTYADVRPSTFSCSCSGGKQALVAMGGHRKPSRSSIRTSSSVHEIIWTRDDSPSSAASYSFDLTKSASLSPVTDRGSVGYGSISVPKSSVQALQRVTPPKSATFPRAVNEDVGPVNDSLSHYDFSNWSWESNVTQDNVTLGKSHRLGSISAKDSESQKISKHKQKVRIASIIADPETVESFPPLLNRRKTSDWQRLPLVDLNDPRAGRDESNSGDESYEPLKKEDNAAPNWSGSFPDTAEEQDSSSDREPRLPEKPAASHGCEPEPAVVRLAHTRQSIISRQSRRASANIGVSKASRITKHRRSISDGAIPDVAMLLAQASRMVKKSLSALPSEEEPVHRPSFTSTGKSKSVPSLPALVDAPVPVTTQDPSVRLVEVAGADEGEGEDVGCLVTPGGRNKSRLSLSLDWIA